MEYFDTLLENSNLRMVYREGFIDFTSLDLDDQDVFCILMYQAFFNFSEAFYEYKHEHFDEDQWLESRKL